jgi:hypothetical protein
MKEKPVELRRRLALLRTPMSDVAFEFWEHPNLVALYPRYLVLVHTLIRASVPLMQDALSVARTRNSDEPFCEQFIEYMEKHIPEEVDHDEWLLGDLAQLGICRDDVMRQAPCATAAALVGSQYYYIRHVHPAIFLGYVGALEGFPLNSDLVNSGAKRTGYPVSAFATLLKHAELDPGHARELDAAIASMRLSENVVAMTYANGLQTLISTIKLTRMLIDGAIDTLLDFEH